jgi:hypothetical protein
MANTASSSALVKAVGLNTSPNVLDRPDGSLVAASNVIIKRDGIIEPRRGFHLFGNQLPSSTDRVKQLATYQQRILRHFEQTLQYDSSGSGDFLSFAGSFVEAQTGLRIKFIESNGNFYFTTADGIKKISAKSNSQFTTDSGYITDAGAVKAVDLQGEVIYTPNSQSGFLPQDSAVAYRVVWAYNDANSNLISGAPSQREIVSNSMLELIIRDYMRGLDVLDNFANSPLTSARINDKNYVSTLKLTLNSSATDLYTNLIALASKIDTDIFLADQAAVAPLQISSASITSGICTVTFTGSVTSYLSAGSKIMLAGFTPAVGTLNGAQTVVTAGATTITFNTAATGAVALSSATVYSNAFRNITQPAAPSSPATNQELTDLQSYYENIVLQLSAQPAAIISAADQLTVNTLDITTTSTVQLSITIPEGIDSKYFFQIYRSAVSQATGAALFDDVSPNDELQLVYEAYPTSAEIAAGVIEVEDVTPDAFRGANLYTNASTGEGILAANDIPPFAKDINRYRNSVFYANTRTKHRSALNLLGVTQMISDYDAGTTPKLTITNGDVTNTYSFVTGLQEIASIVTVADVANSLNGKYFLLNSVKNAYYVWFETTTATDPAISGRTGIKVSISTGATATTVATRLRDKLTGYLDDFILSGATNTVTVTNFDTGVTPDAVDFNTGFAISTTQQGRGERIQPQITEVVTVGGASYVSSGTADYFTLNTTLNKNQFYIWFQKGTATDPAISGKSGIAIPIAGAETAAQVAALIKANLSSTLFDSSVLSNILTITNVQYGTCTAAAEVVVNAGFIVSTTQTGALEVLLSPVTSPAIAVEQTALSLIRSINKNPGESVYGFYLSSSFDVPGQMIIEARSLNDTNPFYILGNNANTGLSFNPNIGPAGFINSITAANPTVITTTAAHGLVTGDTIVISSTNSVQNMDGKFEVLVISPTTFSIAQQVITSGNTGSFVKTSDAVFSENEEKANRVYYSKFQQPESVPIVNYFDVGAQDKAILRIFPLRDSLFVFKEDGLYRISGDSAPFQLNLFDNSFIVLAPDSVSVANNVIYAWTTQGIQSLTEGGAYVISRAIDNIILKLQSSNYTNFKTATWATGYESDNSYTAYTVAETDDTVATIGFRYSTLTQSWTNIDKSPTCGIINSVNDKMFLGASDVAYIEQERKSFNRTDYADREYDTVISSTAILNNTIVLPTVTGYAVGDVFVQDQTLTVFGFNGTLDKLDMDTGVSDSNYNTLAMSLGSNPRTSLNLLAAKLDSDAGVNYSQFVAKTGAKTGTVTAVPVASTAVITSVAHGLISGRIVQFDSMNSFPAITGPYEVTVINANSFSVPVRITTAGTSGNWQTIDSNFEDIKACYNFIMTTLNSDTGTSFNNYKIITSNTLQETIITTINTVTKRVTLNLTLDYLVGACTIYKAIPTTFTYNPNTMGDPLGLKHLREATLMFEVTNITSATMFFSTDLLPEFIPVDFNLSGNGIFGHQDFGTGFFGGIGNAAPFRTYIPRQCQRCRYMVVKFNHSTARETYAITGMTLTGNIGQSSRAYR